MKKMMMKYLVLTLILSTLVACTQEQPATTTNNTTVNNNGGGTGDTGGSDTGGDDGSDTGGGTGSGYPIHQFDLMLAGHQAWMPGTYSDPEQQAAMPTIQEASYIFASDTKLQIRFKVNSQPVPTSGETYCYGRKTGSASDPYRYTKLRFRVHLRDIKCDSPSSSNPNSCNSGFYLGNRYRTQYIDPPVNVGSYSPIIDIGSMRNQTQWGTVVEVEDVKSDSDCQYGYSEYNCPSEKIVREASCWHMTMQVVTDYTKSF